MKRSHKEDSRLYDLRCTICCAVLVLIAAIRPLHAQDVLPGSLSCHAGGADCDTLCLYSQRTDTVSVPLITFPAAFRQITGHILEFTGLLALGALLRGHGLRDRVSALAALPKGFILGGVHGLGLLSGEPGAPGWCFRASRL